VPFNPGVLGSSPRGPTTFRIAPNLQAIALRRGFASPRTRDAKSGDPETTSRVMPKVRAVSATLCPQAVRYSKTAQRAACGLIRRKTL